MCVSSLNQAKMHIDSMDAAQNREYGELHQMARVSLPHRRALLSALSVGLFPPIEGCSGRHALGLVLRFESDADPVICNYFTDERARDKSRRRGLYISPTGGKEFAFTPRADAAEPSWIQVEWLYPIAEGGKSRDESVADSTRYTRRFYFSSLVPKNELDRIRASDDKLLVLIFTFTNANVVVRWSVNRW